MSVRRRVVAAAFLAVLAGLISASYVVVTALAAPVPPAPTIAAHPANPTSATSAPSVTLTFPAENGRYETGIPRAPVIISGPRSPFTQTTVEFTFIDRDWPHVRFSCRLDSGPVVPCTGDTDHDGDGRLGWWGDPWGGPWWPFRGDKVEGEKLYKNLAPGLHCFYVYVTDRAGNMSPTTTDCWTIPGPTQSFTVGGNLTSPLYPGTSEPLDLTFTNPNSAPITIASGGITASNIAITTGNASCAASNFAVSQGLAASVTIAAHQSTPISLSALSIPQADWPVITMIDTHANQDACEGATLTLTYSGIEATG